jgi:hypothetical protein
MTGATRITTYVVGGVILCIAVFFFLVRPALNRVSGLNSEVQVTEAELNRLEQQILAYKTAQSDLSKATNKDLLFTTFVDDKNLHVPIEEMESVAKITGTEYMLKIHRDSIENAPVVDRRRASSGATGQKKVTNQNVLEEIPYTLSVQNPSYTSMITFMKHLEHIPHFTEISGVDMTSEGGEEGEPILVTATINGVFLVKKNETPTK